ncbi:ribonuclease HII [uncultured Imperialibacter sp.]|uniref:ribonuclease HII n=1 Tax=uncultured Imperialibacter sp. TaxID=1672639 RepID=UPI0030DACDD9|tara:strand:- start:363 stop:962 length:600 start_codon:yes stop_codon:yes gene_type:complete
MLLPFFNKGVIEAGCDEAGRGCLAGPVVAAAVILPPDFHHKVLTDSKQLSEKQRMALKEDVKSAAIAWAVGWCSPEEIDKINILNASFVAMHRAVDQLKKVPEHLLIDGNRFKKYKELPHNCIIKGDSLYYSIAAASILAKTYRDEWMERLGEEFPVFQWAKNKGYPTMDHREAIRAHGITPYHRKSFRLLPEQMELFK